MSADNSADNDLPANFQIYTLKAKNCLKIQIHWSLDSCQNVLIKIKMLNLKVSNSVLFDYFKNDYHYELLSTSTLPTLLRNFYAKALKMS